MLHNETMNIWSHLLGFIFMSCLSIYGFNVCADQYAYCRIPAHFFLLLILEPFSRCIIQRSNRIYDILHSSIKMPILFIDISYFYMPLASTSKIIYCNVRLYGHLIFDYGFSSRDRILWILL